MEYSVTFRSGRCAYRKFQAGLQRLSANYVRSRQTRATACRAWQGCTPRFRSRRRSPTTHWAGSLLRFPRDTRGPNLSRVWTRDAVPSRIVDAESAPSFAVTASPATGLHIGNLTSAWLCYDDAHVTKYARVTLAGGWIHDSVRMAVYATASDSES